MKELIAFEFGTGDDRALDDGRVLSTAAGIVVELDGFERATIPWDVIASELAARGGRKKSAAKAKAARQNWKKAFRRLTNR